MLLLTDDMGPTGVVPGSQYMALDRGPTPGGSEISIVGDGPMPEDFADRDRWFGEAIAQLGGVEGDGIAVENHLVELPPGSIAITHHQVFHRASRNTQQDPWRPMVKLGAARVSEPLPCHGCASDSAAAPVPSCIESTVAAMRRYVDVSAQQLSFLCLSLRRCREPGFSLPFVR